MMSSSVLSVPRPSARTDLWEITQPGLETVQFPPVITVSGIVPGTQSQCWSERKTVLCAWNYWLPGWCRVVAVVEVQVEGGGRQMDDNMMWLCLTVIQPGIYMLNINIIRHCQSSSDQGTPVRPSWAAAKFPKSAFTAERWLSSSSSAQPAASQEKWKVHGPAPCGPLVLSLSRNYKLGITRKTSDRQYHW